ncbi:hypothetical protein [Stieleria sp.]|uniref:hypothetical protein n=1 Tax=Stieleria sp. TaxID=2795976 RepID=UPI0035695AF6
MYIDRASIIEFLGGPLDGLRVDACQDQPAIVLVKSPVQAAQRSTLSHLVGMFLPQNPPQPEITAVYELELGQRPVYRYLRSIATTKVTIGATTYLVENQPE